MQDKELKLTKFLKQKILALILYKHNWTRKKKTVVEVDVVSFASVMVNW